MLPIDVSSLIPQKEPFVMVDALLNYNEIRTQTTFKVKPENVFVINDEFTEAGLMENIAQTAAARAGYIAAKESKPILAGYIASVKNFEIFNLPKVGDELFTELKIENQVFDVTVVSGSVTCKGILMGRCEMNIFVGS